MILYKKILEGVWAPKRPKNAISPFLPLQAIYGLEFSWGDQCRVDLIWVDFNFLMSQEAPIDWALNSWTVHANHGHPNGHCTGKKPILIRSNHLSSFWIESLPLHLNSPQTYSCFSGPFRIRLIVKFWSLWPWMAAISYGLLYNSHTVKSGFFCDNVNTRF